MQRKTNLFYVNGNDSNFLTFSNYTESLTGNYLATDWKMYPSKFICLNIPSLTKDNKADFIKHIVATYENKLAFMRDYYMNKEDEERVEDEILPFEWLIESIYAFDSNTEINLISEIVEHSYNGLYADTICTIDTEDCAKEYTIIKNNAFSLNDPINYADSDGNKYSSSYLYGWYVNGAASEKYTGVSSFGNVKPLGDDYILDKYNESHPDEDPINVIVEGMDKYYDNCPLYKSISIGTKKETGTIKFNVIVPLFDVTNMNTSTNTTTIDETIDLTTQMGTDDECKINIPLGIWFANETISLERDTDTGYTPAWSLVLGTQFKPFPYSSSLTDEISTTHETGAYNTFAQILARQNDLIDTFSNLNSQIADLSSRLQTVETQLSNISTSYALDDIHIEMVDFKNQIMNLLENNNVSTSTSYMVWKANFTE